MKRATLSAVLALSLTACTPADLAVVAPVTGSPGTAVSALASLPVKGRAPMTGYTRAAFLPHGWEDPDGNGCDSRRDALARQAVGQPVLAGPHHCVLTATIADPYSGTNLPSTKVDTDHRVALFDAWQSGADRWTQARREEFANDPLELVAVSASLNGPVVMASTMQQCLSCGPSIGGFCGCSRDALPPQGVKASRNV